MVFSESNFSGKLPRKTHRFCKLTHKPFSICPGIVGLRIGGDPVCIILISYVPKISLRGGPQVFKPKHHIELVICRWHFFAPGCFKRGHFKQTG